MATPFHRGGQQGWAHEAGPAGTFHTFDALALGGASPRPVHLLLPPDLDDGLGPRDLLLMHDGDTVFWPGGALGRSWQVPAALVRLRGALRAPVVVAVPPMDRNHEYTHVDWAAGARTWGGLPAYTDWLADGLLPWLRAHYPVVGRAAVVGASHGGLAAFYAATARPDAFDRAGAMSPSVWAGVDGWEVEGPERRMEQVPWVQQALSTLRGPDRPRLWLCFGRVRTGGFHNARTEALATLRGRELARLCQGLGYRRQDLGPGVTPDPEADLFVYDDPTGEHDEASWSRRLPALLRALARRA